MTATKGAFRSRSLVTAPLLLHLAQVNCQFLPIHPFLNLISTRDPPGTAVRYTAHSEAKLAASWLRHEAEVLRKHGSALDVLELQ